MICVPSLHMDSQHLSQNSKQPELIQPENLLPRLRWEKLFAFLPPWPELPAKIGRKPTDRQCLLKACIYQRLKRMRFLRELHTHLLENPPITATLGFDPYQAPPSLERFSAFLSDTPHSFLQQTRIELTQTLISIGVIMLPARLSFSNHARTNFFSLPTGS